VSFLFTDVERSTQLWEHHDQQMDAALARHDEILRSSIENERGYIFSTAGDAFCAAFVSPVSACLAALAIQDRLAAEHWSTPEPIRVRMGLHVGEAHERDGDYFGPALNRAARIMAAAHGGQVVASDAFTVLARTGTDLGPMTDLGQHRLKDLSAPEQIWQVNQGSFPLLRTLDVTRHNLPVERTTLIGREGVVEDLVDLIGQYRLVTILGIGGSGKTRAAVAMAAEVVEQFPDGVWFVDLVPTGDADDIAEAIASAAGLQLAGTSVLEALTGAIADRRALFVVDNCEHVTDATADVLDALLEATTAPRFVATSREPLDLIDERRFTLDPLPVAADDASPAVRLFRDAASRIGADIAGDHLAIVAEICEHLDGHPLSIELATAQLAQLTTEQLLGHLNERFELLTRTRRRSRHATLLGVLESTWDMLDERGQLLLVQLAAFPSSFGLDEITGVTRDLDVGSVASGLRELTDRSLVASDGTGRFRLLESIKLFARQQSDDTTDSSDERHTQWVLGHLRSYPRDVCYTSFEISGWIHDHEDDWRAVEDRLAAQARWTDLADLASRSLLYYQYGGATRAIAQIDRIERYLTDVEASDHETIGRLHSLAALCGLPARRPDQIERSGPQAAVHLGHADPVDLANAMIIETWPVALSDPSRALQVLNDAYELAERSSAPGVANVALGYRAVALALTDQRDELEECLEHLSARFDIDAQDYPFDLHNSSTVARIFITDPVRALSVIRDRRHPPGPPNGFSGLFLSATAAAADEAAEALETLRTAKDVIRQQSAEDGFPDLLLPPAALAYVRGERERCRRLLTAIRHSATPTQNFFITITYRRLRNEVGLAPDNPLVDQPIDEIFEDALVWMQSVAEGRQDS
jgi:predicted ATPase/class 3 adenylate cyclase